MLAQDGVAFDRVAHPGDEVRLQDVERPARERPQELVPRRSRDRAMEPCVGQPELVGRGPVAKLGSVRDRRLELANGLGRRIRRGQARERDLHLDARLDELLQRDAVGLEHRRDGLAEIAADPLVLGARHEHTAARPPGRSHEVRPREQPEGLPEGGTADAEFVRQLVLGAETFPRAEALFRDVPADLAGDLLAVRPSRLREA